MGRIVVMWLDGVIASVLCLKCVRCGALGIRPLCESCQAKGPLLATTRGGASVLALGSYHEALGAHVRALKYGEETRFAAQLGRALAQVMPETYRTATLVPVPLHPARLVERGFNQSALLARAIAKETSQRVDFTVLKRTRQTEVQARLNKAARSDNVQGAFSAQKRIGSSKVVLVDDVVTTGATIESALQALAAAGIPTLGLLCCALGGEDAMDQPPDSQKTVKASPPSSRSAGRESMMHE